jgi:hypothetical protein
MHRSAALAIVLPLCLAGCHRISEATVEGKWKCTDVQFPKSLDPSKADAIRTKVLATTAEFKPNKTFTVSLGGEIAGNWSLKGDTVTLTTTTIEGQPVEKMRQFAMTIEKNNPEALKAIKDSNPNMSAVMGSDGKTMSLRQEGADKGSMILTKVK